MKKRGLRGQASTEYLMVAALAMIVVFPLIFVFSNKASDSIDTVVDSQVTDIGNSIVDNAEIVYYQGEPSRVTIEHTFPDTITDIYTLGGEELVFVLHPDKELVFTTDVPINGSFGEQAFSAGRKNIKISAVDGYVNITIF